MSALLSVVVPVYNAAAFLPRCLDSLIQQTYSNLEIICVNDGSTDGSAVILDAYAAKDSRIKVIHQENAGVSAARNRGLDAATGEIIGFCDADDSYVDGALQTVATLFEEYSCKLVVTGFELVSENNERIQIRRETQEHCSARRLQESMMHDSRIMGAVWNKFFASSIIKGVDFDRRLTHCEDMHFVSQVLCRSPEMPVIISPGVTYEYHCNAASATANPARLLDEQGKLRYLAALDSILHLYPGDWQMWLLVRSSQFCLVADNMRYFEHKSDVERRLARCAIRYAPAYILCRRRAPLKARITGIFSVAKKLFV